MSELFWWNELKKSFETVFTMISFCVMCVCQTVDVRMDKDVRFVSLFAIQSENYDRHIRRCENGMASDAHEMGQQLRSFYVAAAAIWGVFGKNKNHWNQSRIEIHAQW